MKRNEYKEVNLYTLGGGSISSNIKRMLVENKHDINKIVLNKHSYIDAIETVHALKEENIISYEIDNDLCTGNVLFFNDDKLIGESL
jgi:dTDP-D-glucose 4,6-dehydratase